MWPQGSGTSGTTCAGEINESPHQEKGVCPQGKLGKKSSEACVSSDTYMSVARAAAAAISAEEYLDGGNAAFPVRPPIPLYPFGITMGTDGLLVGPDGVVQGSDEDMSCAWALECDHTHPDHAGATGPVIHGPEPRMASHLMP